MINIGKVCKRNVSSVDWGDSVLDAVRLMRRNHVGDVVVTKRDSGGIEPVGIITDRDIVVELIAEQVDMEKITVGDVMSYELLTAKEDADLLSTLKDMRSKGVRRIPVVDKEGYLAGIFSVDDMIELLATQLTDIAYLFARERDYEEATRT